MSEIRNNEVEQNKPPEPSSPREASEADSKKLKPADSGEEAVESPKKNASENRDSTNGEHPKLKPENGADDHDKGEKVDPNKGATNHDKLATGEGNAEQTKQPVKEDASTKPVGEGNAEQTKQPMKEDASAKPVNEGNAEQSKQPVKEDASPKPVDESNVEQPKQPMKEDASPKPVDESNVEQPKQPVKEDASARSVNEGNAEQPKQPVKEDASAKPVDEGNAEQSKQPVKEDASPKPVDESNVEQPKQPVKEDASAKPVDEGNAEQPKQPVENTENPSTNYNPQNLPVISERAPLRSDLPEGATTDGKIGDYPVKFANWDPAFANPEDAVENKTLEPGTYYRYGGPDGNFITKREPGQSLENLYDGAALPYDYDPSKWSVVDVKEPLDNVHCGEVGPQSKFGLDGGGWQAELPHALWEYPSDQVSMRPLREEEIW